MDVAAGGDRRTAGRSVTGAEQASAAGLVAITHAPSPRLEAGERTFVGYDEIDFARALRQHAAYEDALRTCGARVVELDVNRALPDCVFVEDTAIVLDEVAVMMSMGAVSRRAEPPGIERALRAFREIERIVLPATIDGGDVVRFGRSLYVGESARTNAAGVMALRDVVARYGYTVTGVPVHGCLHLKSACSALPDGSFLVNANWIDVSPLPAGRLVHVPVDEPWAGDVLVIAERIIASDAFPRTIALLRSRGWTVLPVAVSEFAKAEGGVTCMSLVFRGKGDGGRGETAEQQRAKRAMGSDPVEVSLQRGLTPLLLRLRYTATAATAP